ncbi:Ku protein [Pseudomonas shahriarae]|uniref:non-homologous end joining protein Ku n=1 Tax=Pseudomonas shahriarae TaxID=2745512 RepID=UPI0020768662|nr:Ku protein [Pseudomonas shahriarae]MCM8563181.1 Ku protein [Pseudomonas shahriarae]
MPRAIWKGAISFGLVHIPVSLVSATSAQGVDFDWLDNRSMDPVGYKRINKTTGKEVTKDNIVKGVAYEKGRYVVLSEEEIRAAHPKSTQTIEIIAFIDRDQIPLQNIDTPYYLAPDKRGGKVYALLRETLDTTAKVALANVILHTKQHLAALMPLDSALVLVMLRWPAEVRGLDELELGEDVIKPSLAKGERDMARRLVEGMSADWQPDDYRDSFQDKIMALVKKKAKAGKIENVEAQDGAQERKSADVLDLTELLKRSLAGKSTAKPAARKKTTKAS